MANSLGPDQTAPIGAVCSGSTSFASIINLSVMLDTFCCRRLQQTTFSDAFFLGILEQASVYEIRVILWHGKGNYSLAWPCAGNFEPQKQMFKLMDKKIVTVYRSGSMTEVPYIIH